MAGQRVRTGIRAGIRAVFALCGVGLVIAAVAMALHGSSELTSLAALLAGVLLIVIGGTGRLPEEIGLQRITFDQPDDRLGAQQEKNPATVPGEEAGDASGDASSYQEAFYAAVREELPHLRPPAAGPLGQASRSIWVEELDLRIVVTWSADETCRFDVSVVEPAIEQTPGSIPVILVTNVDDLDDVRAALRARHGDRTAVVRWRSRKDNEALRRAAHRLGNALPSRHRQRAHEDGRDD